MPTYVVLPSFTDIVGHRVRISRKLRKYILTNWNYFLTKMPSSNSFYVVVPSNTNIEGNRTNSFRVRLPRKLQFGSDWDVGLSVIVYPHSWPSLGTVDDQFVQVDWQSGESVRIQVPASNITNPEELRKNMYRLLGEGSEELAKKTRTAQLYYRDIRDVAYRKAQKQYIATKKPTNLPVRDEQEDDESYQKKLNEYFNSLLAEEKKEFGKIFKQLREEAIEKMDPENLKIYKATRSGEGFEAWVHAYRKVRFACQFNFDSLKNRFSLKLDTNYVTRVKISEQLAYIMGFSESEFVQQETVARFMPDMSGGVSSFHVYAPDLIEPMMIGDVMAPVLRIVTIRGKADEIIEEQFLSIQYHRVLLKEISEIFIEIRTASGTLMPFSYGTCTLTLHFRKTNYF